MIVKFKSGNIYRITEFGTPNQKVQPLLILDKEMQWNGGVFDIYYKSRFLTEEEYEKEVLRLL